MIAEIFGESSQVRLSDIERALTWTKLGYLLRQCVRTTPAIYYKMTGFFSTGIYFKGEVERFTRLGKGVGEGRQGKESNQVPTLPGIVSYCYCCYCCCCLHTAIADVTVTATLPSLLVSIYCPILSLLAFLSIATSLTTVQFHLLSSFVYSYSLIMLCLRAFLSIVPSVSTRHFPLFSVQFSTSCLYLYIFILLSVPFVSIFPSFFFIRRSWQKVTRSPLLKSCTREYK